ncbi:MULTISPECIES: TVP38/TMEM64 family protein [unclassified Roseofilum]|uniref:TVP38/TMEM64 family protein n=1 Tax=unclassified Roseofilum TaxID=2620099 RepID=UPI00298E814C|nr:MULTISPECIES: TVP38/TMEM64 family protein [unclassified Roseofilum]
MSWRVLKAKIDSRSLLGSMKGIFLIIFVISIIVTLAGVYWLAGVDSSKLELWLESTGFWTPLFFMMVYIISTLLILPTTPLNLMGGVIFGPWLGLFWTSLASIISALIGFGLTRITGQKMVSDKLKGYWKAMDAEMYQGGVFYIFAIRLLPVIPYGIVNFAAGLTSVSFKDYLLGTAIGTILGLFPFILLGSEGVKAIQTGEILPLLVAFALSGLLIGMATWYRRRRMISREIIEKINPK